MRSTIEMEKWVEKNCELQLEQELVLRCSFCFLHFDWVVVFVPSFLCHLFAPSQSIFLIFPLLKINWFILFFVIHYLLILEHVVTAASPLSFSILILDTKYLFSVLEIENSTGMIILNICCSPYSLKTKDAKCSHWAEKSKKGWGCAKSYKDVLPVW